VSPELFFPVGTTGPALLQLAEAKRVCAGCPVQCMCLEWAMLAGVEHGVWGGLGEEERRNLKRRSRRTSVRRS
jgi:WhiB family redox-sensing transcriptional regulator